MSDREGADGAWGVLPVALSWSTPSPSISTSVRAVRFVRMPIEHVDLLFLVVRRRPQRRKRPLKILESLEEAEEGAGDGKDDTEQID